MPNEEVSGRSLGSGSMHVYQDLKKPGYHGVTLLLFDNVIFFVKGDGS